MLKLQEEQFVKLTGTTVKGENDIYVVEHDYNIEGKYAVCRNEYCLIKVKLDGTQKSGGYRYYFYNEKSAKNDPEMNIEIVTDLKKAKKEVNDYLKGVNSEEIVVSFERAEDQEVKEGSIIRFPNGIKFGTFGEKHIGTRTIWKVNFRDNGTIYIRELGKKGQNISSGDEYGCSLGLTKQIIEVCEVLTKIETKKCDMIKEVKPIDEESKNVEIVAETLEVEEKEESQQENNSQVVLENTTNQNDNDAIEFIVNEDVHTKTGETIFVAKLSKTVSKDEFINISIQIKSIGGYWSKFKKGFLFKEEPTQLLNDTFNNSESKEVKDNQESNTVKVELKEVQPIEINIDNINAETFPISKEVSDRENSGHWTFRIKERNHQQEILNYLQNFQDIFISELNKLEDNTSENSYKRWLNSFKKALL